MSKTQTQKHYESQTLDDPKLEVLKLLLSAKESDFKLGIDKYSKYISSHVGKTNLNKYLKKNIQFLDELGAFLLENDEYLSPSEALDMIETCLYQEILFEEFKIRSGKRGFFIADFRHVHPDFVYFCFEFLLAKVSGIKVKDLLGLSKGLNYGDLKIISRWNPKYRLEVFIKLSRVLREGIFQDQSFVRFSNYKRINDVEDFIDVLFREIIYLSDFFEDTGDYFSIYGNVRPIKALPAQGFAKKKKKKVSKRLPVKLSPVERNLKILKLKKMPSTLKELKKVFYKLALERHPDKFEHLDQGTQTRARISSNFREIMCAYEFIEKELNKK